MRCSTEVNWKMKTSIWSLLWYMCMNNLWLPTCFLMASRSLSCTKSSLSCTLVSLVLRGSENSWKKLSSGSKLLSVWTNSIYLCQQSNKTTENVKQHQKRNRAIWDSDKNITSHIRVDQLVADFTGKEDVRAQADLVPESLVAHGLPEVPQAEDGGQSHEALRVVTCFGCHVGLLLSDSDQGRAVQGTLGWAVMKVKGQD